MIDNTTLAVLARNVSKSLDRFATTAERFVTAVERIATVLEAPDRSPDDIAREAAEALQKGLAGRSAPPTTARVCPCGCPLGEVDKLEGKCPACGEVFST